MSDGRPRKQYSAFEKNGMQGKEDSLVRQWIYHSSRPVSRLGPRVDDGQRLDDLVVEQHHLVQQFLHPILMTDPHEYRDPVI